MADLSAVSVGWISPAASVALAAKQQPSPLGDAQIRARDNRQYARGATRWETVGTPADSRQSLLVTHQVVDLTSPVAETIAMAAIVQAVVFPQATYM